MNRHYENRKSCASGQPKLPTANMKDNKFAKGDGFLRRPWR